MTQRDRQIQILKEGFKEAFEAMTKAVIKATFSSQEFKIEMDHIVANQFPWSWRCRFKYWLCFFSSKGHDWKIHHEGQGCIQCARCHWHLWEREVRAGG